MAVKEIAVISPRSILLDLQWLDLFCSWDYEIIARLLGFNFFVPGTVCRALTKSKLF